MQQNNKHKTNTNTQNTTKSITQIKTQITKHIQYNLKQNHKHKSQNIKTKQQIQTRKRHNEHQQRKARKHIFDPSNKTTNRWSPISIYEHKPQYNSNNGTTHTPRTHQKHKTNK